MTVRHHILYAEDDPDDLLLVKQAFEAHPHINLVHAANGLDALQLLQEMLGQNYLPSLVILDINMPVMDGKEALSQIRAHEKLSHLPVVLFSTSNSVSDKHFAQQWAVDLVTKPQRFEELQMIAADFAGRCQQ